MGNDPVQVKFDCKEVDLLWKQQSCTHFATLLRNRSIAKKTRSVNANRTAIKFRCLITSSGTVVANQNNLSNGIKILTGDDPVPVKFDSKGTDPNTKDACFTFRMRRAVQSALADLVHFSNTSLSCRITLIGYYAAHVRVVLSIAHCLSVCKDCCANTNVLTS